jgi:hypothetical protein
VYTFNFDPGGDKSSLAANYGGNHSIFSLLLLPWDRGKMVFSSFLFPVANLAPAMVSFPARGAFWLAVDAVELYEDDRKCRHHFCKTREGRGSSNGKWEIEVNKILH